MNDKKIYFISDVHLGYYDRNIDKKREDLLLECLKWIMSDCARLVIVGDFFDYWFEWNKVIPRYFYRTLAMLHQFVDNGIEIDYLMGNHDFGHRSFFRDELGITVHCDSIEREFFGKNFYIYHGDGLSYQDGAYRILKKILRNKLCLSLYTRCFHPDWAINLASSTSNKSRKFTDSKKYSEGDGMQDFAFSTIDSGFDYVIFGHRHKLAHIKHNKGYYVNLGDWFKNPGFGVFDGQEFSLIPVDEILCTKQNNK